MGLIYRIGITQIADWRGYETEKCASSRAFSIMEVARAIPTCLILNSRDS